MKRLKKIGVILLSICLLTVGMSSEAFAASAKVGVSSASGNIGKSVTVTCTISMSGADIGGADVTLEYDPAALSVTGCSNGANGASGSVIYSGYATGEGQTSLNFTVTFKILKEGKHGIKVSYADVFDFETMESVTASKSGGSVTGKAENTEPETKPENKPQTEPQTKPQTKPETSKPQVNTKDGNNKLQSLSVYPGTLAPVFSAGTTSYTVTVPGETKDVTIAATPQSSKANVTVSGGKDLKLGENKAKIVVTAENDSTKVYNITIVCGEVEKITIDGKENIINESFKDDQIPTGFSRTKLTYNGRQYEGVSHGNSTLKLMNLQNADKSEFYIYDQETQEFQNFVQVQIASGKYIYPTALDEMDGQFVNRLKTTVSIKEKVFDAWKLNEEFSVICALNQNGQILPYRYDSVDGTFQRYMEIEETQIEVEDVVEKPDTEKFMYPEEYYWYALAGLGALTLVLFITVICLAATRKGKHKVGKNRAQKKAEKLAKKQATQE